MNFNFNFNFLSPPPELNFNSTHPLTTEKNNTITVMGPTNPGLLLKIGTQGNLIVLNFVLNFYFFNHAVNRVIYAGV